MTIQGIPHVFGDLDHLVGIVHPADTAQADFGVIMVTPGMLHHAGPFRLHVRLAQALGEQGITSLRFDLSGIGESLAVGSAGNSLDRAQSEIQAAMDMLGEQYGLSKFVLFGLCSGADDGMHAALNDERITGLVMMDGCGYPTRKYYSVRAIKHYLPRSFHWGKWKSFFGVSNSAPASSTLQLGNDIREFPSREVAEQQVCELASRNVRMRFIYTGGVAEYYNYAGQFADMFPQVPMGEQVSTRFFPQMDHVALLVEDREAIVDEVVGWISA